MPKRSHPDYYYAIRDMIVAGMGPQFDLEKFRRLFPKAAAPHQVIPYTDGYLAHRKTIEGLVKSELRRKFANIPKTQDSLV